MQDQSSVSASTAPESSSRTVLDRFSQRISQLPSYFAALTLRKAEDDDGGTEKINTVGITLSNKPVGTVRIIASPPAHLLPYGKLLIKSRKIIIAELLGQQLGVKFVVLKRIDPQDLAEISGKEDKIWSKFDHPNILPFLGECSPASITGTEHYIVSPYCEYGTPVMLLKHRPQLRNAATLHDFAVQMLTGLEYVHGQGYAHGDFKIDNVLMVKSGDGFRVVICDFGLSTEIVRDENHVPTSDYLRSLGHRRYLSSEHLEGGVKILEGSYFMPRRKRSTDEAVVNKSGGLPRKSPQGDMWSFGMVVLQLYTGSHPWLEVLNEGNIAEHIRLGRRPQFPTHTENSPITLALWRACGDCWEHYPWHRPTASQLLRNIKDAGRSAINLPASVEDMLRFVREEVVSLTSEIRTDAHQTDLRTSGGVTTFRSLWVAPDGETIVEEDGGSYGRLVILKRYEGANLIEQWSPTLLREVFYWKWLRHEGLLPLLGVCLFGGRWHAVLPDWNERLYRTHIHKLEQGQKGNPAVRNAPAFKMLHDVARTLEFLHGQSPPIAHGAVRLDHVYFATEQLRFPTGETVDACLGNFEHIAIDNPDAMLGDIRDFGILMNEASTPMRARSPADSQTGAP
ncbi:kinase-like protein [Auricularia subglabra TFB-10046 SS5]|nr:kinase-like protein [Auricularia subglabra TFB-10046 SS5]